jgi:hypothetical protein
MALELYSTDRFILDDKLLLRTKKGFAIVNINSSEVDILDIESPRTLEEQFWLSEKAKLIDNGKFITIEGRSGIYIIDVKTKEITTNNIKDIYDKDINNPHTIRGKKVKQRYYSVDYISDDFKTFTCNAIGTQSIIHENKILYTYESTTAGDFDGENLYYTKVINNTLTKYNASTNTETTTELRYHVDGAGYTKNYIIGYAIRNPCTVYDKKTLKLKYTIEDVMNYNERYICCRKEKFGTRIVSIHNIDDGRCIRTFSFDYDVYHMLYNDLLCASINDITTVYSVHGKKLGYLKINNETIKRNVVWTNHKYLHVIHVTPDPTQHTAVPDVRCIFKSHDISDLYNGDRKLEFLKGKNSPESSIARIVANPLFDEHLFGEIFQFMGNTIIIE